MKVYPLPPDYSAAGRALRKQALEALADLRRRYEREAAPYHKLLGEIEMRYAPRYMVAPAEAGNPALERLPDTSFPDSQS